MSAPHLVPQHEVLRLDACEEGAFYSILFRNEGELRFQVKQIGQPLVANLVMYDGKGVHGTDQDYSAVLGSVPEVDGFFDKENLIPNTILDGSRLLIQQTVSLEKEVVLAGRKKPVTQRVYAPDDSTTPILLRGIIRSARKTRKNE